MSSKYPVHYLWARTGVHEPPTTESGSCAPGPENTHMVACVIFINCTSDLSYILTAAFMQIMTVTDPWNSLNMVMNTCDPCALYVEVSKLLMAISSEQQMYLDWPLHTTSFHVLSMLSKVPVVLSYPTHIIGIGVAGTAWTKPVKGVAIISKHTIH